MESFENVVYEISFSCVKSYNGQAGRCLNARFRERHSSLRASYGSCARLPLRCNEIPAMPAACKVAPGFRIPTKQGKLYKAFVIVLRGSLFWINPLSLGFTGGKLDVLERRESANAEIRHLQPPILLANTCDVFVLNSAFIFRNVSTTRNITRKSTPVFTYVLIYALVCF